MNRLITIFKHWKKARIRDALRGHQALKRRQNLELITNIQSELTEKSLELSAKDLSPSIFGAAMGSGELVVRQYMLVRVGGAGLIAAMLRALARPEKALVHPIPIQWRAILKKHGFRLGAWRCELLWRLYTGAAWIYGILQIGRVLTSALASSSDRDLPREPYVYFVGLGICNIPERENEESHNILSWYLQWDGRGSHVNSVRHSAAGSVAMEVNGVSIRVQSGPLPPLADVRTFFRYLVWGVIAVGSSFVSFVRGRWWDGLLLNQAALRAQAAVAPDDSLAREYFFHNSGWLYRPLWTYELESKKSSSTLYFYSTNCERFKTLKGYPGLGYGYKAMNWPRYLVWDSYQADFVRRAAGDSSCVLVVGPIWFSSSAESLPEFKRSYIALFDVTPFRDSKFCSLGLDTLFYTPGVSRKFIDDVISVANEAGFAIIWKRKRNVGRIAHPSYRKFVKSLVEGEALRIVDPDISAFRVAKGSQAVISMPFTSTALIARSLGIPSAYYDPFGMIQKDDRAAHGIDVLNGRAELEKWMEQLNSCCFENKA